MTRRGILVAAVTLASLASVAGVIGWQKSGRGKSPSETTTSAKAVRYHCPMHPTMVSDHPGDCPICQMRMVPMEEDHSPTIVTEPPGTVPAPTRVIYRSTMNPNEVSDTPGKDSMGMDMVPVDVEGEPPKRAAAVPGLSTIRLSAQKQQLIGVKSSPVERTPFRRSIRAVGRVTIDETRLHHIHTKTTGYVEKLYANASGALVRQGEPLLEIFSPELLASQQEYLLALKARSRTSGSTLPTVASSGEELAASARRRLELFDLTDEQIRELETSGRPRRTVTVYAPMTGTVIARNVTHGERIGPEMTLLDIADLSRVWVLASVYEYELPFVHEGQTAAMNLSYVPGKIFEGRVSLIYPLLDAATRTVQVRLEFPNPGRLLKPEMFADVTLTADLGLRLAVPDTAVMETGDRSVVFVDRGDGLFEPREIQLGLRLPDLYEVTRGVAEGERVLTSGNFFIDSESKLKAALAAMSQGASSPGHQR